MKPTFIIEAIKDMTEHLNQFHLNIGFLSLKKVDIKSLNCF